MAWKHKFLCLAILAFVMVWGAWPDTAVARDDCQPVPQIAQWIDLVPGINEVDINNDGIDDLIIKSYAELYTAHSYWLYRVYIRPPPDDAGRSPVLFHVPFLNTKESEFTSSPRDRLTIFSTEGADGTLADLRFFRDPNGRVYALHGRPHNFETYAIPYLFNVLIFRFIEEIQATPGLPPFYFDGFASWSTTRKSHEVVEAIEEEYPNVTQWRRCYVASQPLNNPRPLSGGD